VDWRFGEWGDKFIGVYTDANIVMGAESGDSSLIVGIWRFLRMPEFEMYQGASTNSHNTLDWKRSKIAMFELDVVPQSWKLYVQMGLSITL
jgi:hypothetical protein